MSEVVNNYRRETKLKMSMLKRLTGKFSSSGQLEMFFIVSYAVIVSLFIYVIDYLIEYGHELRNQLAFDFSSSLSFPIWLLINLVTCQLATAPGYFISRHSDGSGYSEIKNILSGIPIYRYLSPEALVAKSIGLVFSKMTCISIGLLGPYVHLTCLLCYRLMKISFFRPLFNDLEKRSSILASSAACGITLAMGTPLGGVVFALESTSSGAVVKNIWKTIALSCFCSLFMQFLQFSVTWKLFIKDNIDKIKIGWELVSFLIAGMLCGVIGGFLSRTVKKIKQIRSVSKLHVIKSRFWYCAIISLCISTITYMIPPLIKGERQSISFLFNNKFPKEDTYLNKLNHPDEGEYLSLVFLFKFFIVIASVSMDLPAGVLGPFMCMGAFFGKFYCHMLKHFFPLSEENIYSIICGSALLAGANQQMSSAVIIFELTGQITHVLPLLLSSLTAILVSKQFAASFNEVLLTVSEVSHRKENKVTQFRNFTVEDVMSKKLNFCIKTSDFRLMNVIRLLFDLPKDFNYAIVLINSKNRVDFTVAPRNVYRLICKFVKEAYFIDEDIKYNLLVLLSYLSRRFEGKYKLTRRVTRKIKKFFMNEEELEQYRQRKEDFRRELRGIICELEVENNIEGSFLSQRVALNEVDLDSEYNVLCIDKNTTCVKVHYLFNNFDISHLYVTDETGVIGVLTKERFFKFANNKIKNFGGYPSLLEGSNTMLH